MCTCLCADTRLARAVVSLLVVFVDAVRLCVLALQLQLRRWNADFSESLFDSEGNLIDENTKGAVDGYVAALGRWVRLYKAGKAAVDAKKA